MTPSIEKAVAEICERNAPRDNPFDVAYDYSTGTDDARRDIRVLLDYITALHADHEALTQRNAQLEAFAEEQRTALNKALGEREALKQRVESVATEMRDQPYASSLIVLSWAARLTEKEGG